jgi:uncharacterized protein
MPCVPYRAHEESPVVRSAKRTHATNEHPKRKDRPGVDRYGRTELHYAAAEGDAKKIASLLAAGLLAGAPDDDGWTPLHAAVQAWSPAICAALLDAGAAVDPQDSRGNRGARGADMAAPAETSPLR